MKAMILAAGRGKRMGKLTAHTPKPLLKVAGKPLIVHHLERFARVGIKKIIINISYLGEQIQAFLGNGHDYGVEIQYSFESEVLETGGGIYQALPLLGHDPFIVMSADIWTDYPLQQLLTPPCELAHLIMVNNPEFHPEGDFGLNNGLLNLIDKKRYTYANMGIYHPGLFLDCQPGHYPLAPLIKTAIQQQKITGEVYNGLWENIGTAEQLVALNERLRVQNL